MVVLTKDEEDNIEACLRSVQGWAREIVVVDDESRDGTVSAARGFTGRVFIRRMDNEGRQRNWASEEAACSWILSLETDEWVTGPLKDQITAALMAETEAAYAIPLRTYIGRWVRYGGWYPAAKVRLWRRGSVRYEEGMPTSASSSTVR